jgi:DNA repair exonuclease SbcCD ATPase subunit
MTDSENLQQIKLDVELLKKDMRQVDYFYKKITDTIEKIQEVNTNLVKMISLHEQKHEQHEKSETELKEDIKELHSRITTVNREMQDRLDQLELYMEKKFEVLHNDIKTGQLEKIEKKSFRESFSEIDRYKWMIGGAIIAISWIIGHVNLDALSKLFK